MTTENESPITHLHEYHPYKIHGERNNAFDHISGKMLDLKEKECRKHKKAVKFFADSLCNYIRKKNKNQNPDNAIQLCIVPSSTAGKVSAGLESILQIVATEHPNLLPNPNGLIRINTIEKLAHGGDRSLEVHMNSIKIADEFDTTKRCVLIDDVYTSGNSLLACKSILEQAGVKVVELIAISKTV